MPDRDRFIAAMEKSGWVQAKAARILGLTPRQIGYALKKHALRSSTSDPRTVALATACRGRDSALICDCRK